MTRENIKKLLKTLEAGYPNFHIADKEITTNLWYELLKDFNDGEILASAKAYMLNDNTGFAPSVGQLVNKLYEIKNINQLNETQAWNLIERAITKYDKQKAFSKLPKILQDTIGTSDYLHRLGQTNIDELNVERITFYKRFRIQKEREKQNAMLPKSVKAIIDNTVKTLERKEL